MPLSVDSIVVDGIGYKVNFQYSKTYPDTFSDGNPTFFGDKPGALAASIAIQDALENLYPPSEGKWVGTSFVFLVPYGLTPVGATIQIDRYRFDLPFFTSLANFADGQGPSIQVGVATNSGYATFTPLPVPEPASLTLWLVAGTTVAGFGRYRKRKQSKA